MLKKINECFIDGDGGDGVGCANCGADDGGDVIDSLNGGGVDHVGDEILASTRAVARGRGVARGVARARGYARDRGIKQKTR